MDAEQSTIIEEQQNKTVETTVDPDKTVESTQVADKSIVNEVVMNEEGDQAKENSAAAEESVGSWGKDEQSEELATEAKEANNKVEEVDMLDNSEQPAEKSGDELEKPKDLSTEEAKENANSSDVNMDQSNQVISEVKDTVAGDRSVVEPTDEPVAEAEPTSNAQEAHSFAQKSFKNETALNESKADKTAEAIAELQQQQQQVPPKKAKIDMGHLQTRQYLDHTVVPILLSGLSSLAKARPENPIEYLANYLLENKTKYEHNQENQSLNGN